MASRARVLSAVLLVGGVAIVFTGLFSALGFSAAGLVASAAAIAGLLYAGAVWFGAAAPASNGPLVFTRDLKIAGGDGRRVMELFAPVIRVEIEARCRAALDGHGSQFRCAPGGPLMEVAPVRLASGVIEFGLLLSGGSLQEIRRLEDQELLLKS